MVPGRVQNPARRGACLTYLTTILVGYEILGYRHLAAILSRQPRA
ncbi:MAG TPA: hypothetical protein VFH90_08380 [Candidatus Limnocylindria bacterium]|nr:hypothetical protein [Candidatus Limnocylindria bacterium]